MSRVCFIALFLCLVFASEYVSANLIRSEVLTVQDVTTKDRRLKKENEEDIKVIPIAVIPETQNDKCAPVGAFCMNSSDCCSNSCLGYMKRCVSGTG